MSNDVQEVGYVNPSGTVTMVPSATSVRMGMCDDPDCGAIHLFLLDQADQPFAEATLSRELIQKFIAGEAEGWESWR
jgi:hypothetical protein